MDLSLIILIKVLLELLFSYSILFNFADEINYFEVNFDGIVSSLDGIRNSCLLKPLTIGFNSTVTALNEDLIELFFDYYIFNLTIESESFLA